MRQDTLLKVHTNLAALKASLNAPPAPTPPLQQQIQINPATNRVVAAVSNAANRVVTNLQRMTITNQGGAGSPVQIKLNPTPSPGAANPK